MSRRRQLRSSARHPKDLAKRRVKFFCTGQTGAPHGPHSLAEYTMRDGAIQPDLNNFMQGEGRTRGWEHQADGSRVLPIDACERCAASTGRQLPFEAVEKILHEMPAHGVLRWDLSTGSVLNF